MQLHSPSHNHIALIRLAVLAAGIAGVLSIGFGAFAAHGLTRLGNPLIVDWVKTGASYQLWHAVALLALAGTAHRISSPWFHAILICFFVGSLCFSGSLYAMALLQWMWLGIFTPIGGVLMLSGWVFLIIVGWRSLR